MVFKSGSFRRHLKPLVMGMLLGHELEFFQHQSALTANKIVLKTRLWLIALLFWCSTSKAKHGRCLHSKQYFVMLGSLQSTKSINSGLCNISDKYKLFSPYFSIQWALIFLLRVSSAIHSGAQESACLESGSFPILEIWVFYFDFVLTVWQPLIVCLSFR